MPLYEYQCRSCNFRFEELLNHKDEDRNVICPQCHESTDRLMSSFSSIIAGGSSTETVDMTIGREANKRWQSYHDRQSKRRGNKELKTFNLPKAKDGKYMPVMALGNKTDVEKRKEYVGALQEHRKNRMEKGIAQFKESGEF